MLTPAVAPLGPGLLSALASTMAAAGPARAAPARRAAQPASAALWLLAACALVLAPGVEAVAEVSQNLGTPPGPASPWVLPGSHLIWMLHTAWSVLCAAPLLHVLSRDVYGPGRWGQKVALATALLLALRGHGWVVLAIACATAAMSWLARGTRACWRPDSGVTPLPGRAGPDAVMDLLWQAAAVVATILDPEAIHLAGVAGEAGATVAAATLLAGQGIDRASALQSWFGPPMVRRHWRDPHRLLSVFSAFVPYANAIVTALVDWAFPGLVSWRAVRRRRVLLHDRRPESLADLTQLWEGSSTQGAAPPRLLGPKGLLWIWDRIQATALASLGPAREMTADGGLDRSPHTGPAPLRFFVYGTHGDHVVFQAYADALRRLGLDATCEAVLPATLGKKDLGGIEQGTPHGSLLSSEYFTGEVARRAEGALAYASGAFLRDGSHVRILTPEPPKGAVGPIRLGEPWVDGLADLTGAGSGPRFGLSDGWGGLPYPSGGRETWLSRLLWPRKRAGGVYIPSSSTHHAAPPPEVPWLLPGDHRTLLSGFEDAYSHGGCGTVKTAMAAGCSPKVLSRVLDRDWLPGSERLVWLGGGDAHVLAFVMATNWRHAWGMAVTAGQTSPVTVLKAFLLCALYWGPKAIVAVGWAVRSGLVAQATIAREARALPLVAGPVGSAIAAACEDVRFAWACALLSWELNGARLVQDMGSEHADLLGTDPAYWFTSLFATHLSTPGPQGSVASACSRLAGELHAVMSGPSAVHFEQLGRVPGAYHVSVTCPHGTWESGIEAPWRFACSARRPEAAFSIRLANSPAHPNRCVCAGASGIHGSDPYGALQNCAWSVLRLLRTIPDSRGSLLAHAAVSAYAHFVAGPVAVTVDGPRLVGMPGGAAVAAWCAECWGLAAPDVDTAFGDTISGEGMATRLMPICTRITRDQEALSQAELQAFRGYVETRRCHVCGNLVGEELCDASDGCPPPFHLWHHMRASALVAALCKTREATQHLVEAELAGHVRGLALFYNSIVRVYAADALGGTGALMLESCPPEATDTFRLLARQDTEQEDYTLESAPVRGAGILPRMAPWPKAAETAPLARIPVARAGAYVEYGCATMRRFAARGAQLLEGALQLCFQSLPEPVTTPHWGKGVRMNREPVSLQRIRSGLGGYTVAPAAEVIGRPQDALTDSVAELNERRPRGQPPLVVPHARRRLPAPFAGWRTRARALRAAEAHDVAAGVNWLDLATPALSDASLARYTAKRNDLMLSDAEISDIAVTIREQAPYLYDHLSLTSPRQMLADWVFKYSCGQPFEGQTFVGETGRPYPARSRRDLRATGWLDAAVATARERLATGRLPAGLHHSFVKSYVVTAATGAAKPEKMRTVVAQCPVDYMVEMAWAWGRHKRYARTWASAPTKIGMPLTQGGYELGLARVGERERLIMVDATEFDSTIPAAIFSVLQENDARSFEATVGYDEALSWARARYSVIESGTIVNLISGNHILKRRGVATGCGGTTDKNSEAMQAILIHCVSKAAGRPVKEFFQHSDLANMGDDGGFGTDLTEEELPAAEVARVALEDFGVTIRIESETKGLIGATFLRKTIVDASVVADELAANGLPPPTFGLVHDEESVWTRQTALTSKESPMRLYERTLGHMLLSSHHPALYAFLQKEALILRAELKAAGQNAFLKSRKIPSYRRVLELNYRQAVLPEAVRPRWTVWQEYLRYEDAAVRVLGTAFYELGAFSARSLVGERISAGSVDALPSMTLRVARALAVVGTPCTSLDAYRGRVADSPFGPCIDTEHAWAVLAEHGPGMSRQEGTAVVEKAIALTLLANRLNAFTSRTPLVRVAATALAVLTSQSSELYAWLSIPYFLATGMSSGYLNWLIPKDPFVLTKRVVVAVVDHVPDFLVMTGLPVGLYEAYSRLVDSAGPTIVAPSPMDTPEAHRGSGVPDRWLQFARSLVVPALTQHGTVLITAATGLGKSRFLPAALLRQYGRVWLLEPRRILCANLDTAMWVRPGRSERDSGVMTCTYGYAAARQQGAGMFRPGDLVVCDEVHDPATEILDLIASLPPGMPVIYLTATGANLSKLAVRPPGAHLKYRGSTPFAITRLQGSGMSVPSALREVQRAGMGAKVLVIEPVLAECRRIAQGLEAQGIHVGILSAGTEVPNTAVIVATQIVDAGITIPGVTAVIDTGRRIVEHAGRLVCVGVDEATSDQRAGRTGRTCDGLYLLVGERSTLPLQAYPSLAVFLRRPALWTGLLNLANPYTTGGAKGAGPRGLLPEDGVEGHTPAQAACLAEFVLRYRTPSSAEAALRLPGIREAASDLWRRYPQEMGELTARPARVAEFLNRNPFEVGLAGRTVRRRWLRLLDGRVTDSEADLGVLTIRPGMAVRLPSEASAGAIFGGLPGVRVVDIESTELIPVLGMFGAGLGLPGKGPVSAMRALLESAHGVYRRTQDPTTTGDPAAQCARVEAMLRSVAENLQVEITLVADGRVRRFNRGGYQYCPTPLLAVSGGRWHLGCHADGRCVERELDTRIVEWGNLLRVGAGRVVSAIGGDRYAQRGWQYRWRPSARLTDQNVALWLSLQRRVPLPSTEGACLAAAFAWFNQEDPAQARLNEGLAGPDTRKSFEAFAEHHMVDVVVVRQTDVGRYDVQEHRPRNSRGWRAAFLVADGHVEPLRCDRLDDSDLLRDEGVAEAYRHGAEQGPAPLELGALACGWVNHVPERNELSRRTRPLAWTEVWVPTGVIGDASHWTEAMSARDALKVIDGVHRKTAPYSASDFTWQEVANYHAATILVVYKGGTRTVAPDLGAWTHGAASAGWGFCVHVDAHKYRIGRQDPGVLARADTQSRLVAHLFSAVSEQASEPMWEALPGYGGAPYSRPALPLQHRDVRWRHLHLVVLERPWLRARVIEYARGRRTSCSAAKLRQSLAEMQTLGQLDPTIWPQTRRAFEHGSWRRRDRHIVIDLAKHLGGGDPGGKEGPVVQAIAGLSHFSASELRSNASSVQ